MNTKRIPQLFHILYKINLIFAFFLCFILLLYLLSFLTLHPILGKTNSIILVDNNGHESITILNGSEGKYIELEKVSPYVSMALISIEDEKFHSHKGIDLSRTIQSFLINIFSGKFEQGGSTITQQLSKNLYFSNDKTILRKIREAFMAMSIETHYNKNKIMEDYINSLYFGEGIKGIYNASKYYFNKEPQSLSLKECAILAALINAPNYYSPKSNKELLDNRTKLVLSKMYEMRFISEREYLEAIKEEPKFTYSNYTNASDGTKYYKDAVIEELKRLGFLEDKYLGKGLVVETTMNNQISNDISYLVSLFQKDDPNIEVSVVILKPFTNEIMTLIGGFSYQRSPFNRSINAKRQIGSTIKPLIYYLGLLNGMSPLSEFTSSKDTFYIKNIGMYEPQNFNNLYANRKINMIEALATSDNIYAVKTTLFLGSKTVCTSLKYFNVDCQPLPSIALGTPEMSLLKLTSIYNTFASLGEYHQPRLIKKISTQSDNKVIYSSSNYKESILDEDYTTIINQMLLAPFDANMKSYVTPTLKHYQLEDKYAAKSGSTHSDSYVIAYNPNITIGVWVGTNDGSELKNSPLAKEIFYSLANYFSSIYQPLWYAPSRSIVVRKIEASSGELSSEGSPYFFLKKDSLI